jgi:hypothetical protein
MTLSSYFYRRTATALLSGAADALASVFFPAPCGICEKLLLRANRVPICEECLASFTPIPKRVCKICGQPIESFYTEAEVGLRCPNCAPPRYAFARARSMAIYEDALVSAILMNAVSTRQHCWRIRSRGPLSRPVSSTYWCARGRGRKSGCSRSKSGGMPYVARLPHGQAAKLTSYASYW